MTKYTIDYWDSVAGQQRTREATAEEAAEIEARAAEAAKPVVPLSVTRRQARQALLLAKDADGISLLDKVGPAIAAIPDPTARGLAEIEWADSLEFVRARPLVVQIGAALGLDDAALDALFIHAATL